MSYNILVYDGITVETPVVNQNSQFPIFLVCKQSGVIVLRYTGLYPDFLKVFLQVILHFFQLFLSYYLQLVVRFRL